MDETACIARDLDYEKIEALVDVIAQTKGRIWIIGLGGSFANAMHFAADLRRLCDVDAEAFTNMAELTARANDDGLETIFATPTANTRDGLIVLSVGGGTESISVAISEAVRAFPGWVGGIVGPNGGVTAEVGKYVIKVPVRSRKRITPHTEAFQAVIWHCIVSHPKLQKRATTW